MTRPLTAAELVEWVLLGVVRRRWQLAALVVLDAAGAAVGLWRGWAWLTALSFLALGANAERLRPSPPPEGP